MTLTSVKFQSNYSRILQIECVKRKFSFSKLADRALFLYLTDEDFRKQLLTNINLELKGNDKQFDHIPKDKRKNTSNLR